MSHDLKTKVGGLFDFLSSRVVALFVLILVSTALVAEENVPVGFPAVEGKSLMGEVVQFPDVFSKRSFHVVVIAFEQEQQSEVDTWLPSLKGLLDEREDVDYFELPTISRMNAVMRWIIYRGMRSGIKDEGDRTRTVTLHIDKEPFKSGLKIDSEESIVLVVVDDKGKVIGRSEGVFGEEKWKGLVAVLEGR